MLRAGPLSSTPVIELLNAKFANAWVLARDLPALRDDAALPTEVRAIAAKLLDDYRYPVDSQIRTADGRLLARAEANEIGPNDAAYLEILRSALESK